MLATSGMIGGMANIGEVGGTVQDVLVRQTNELAVLVSGAQQLSTEMLGTFGKAVNGSDNERAVQIQERLAFIGRRLGETVVAVATVREEGTELLAEWGLGTGTGTAPKEEALRNTPGTSDVDTDATPAAAKKYNQKNPERISAVRLREMYTAKGIDLSALGCIMLDIEPIVVSDVIRPEDLYHANNPVKNPYADGVRSETVPHITLLQGLMQPGPEVREDIDKVLEGWKADTVTIQEVTYFAGADPTEPFDCIVARLENTDEILEGNNRLQLLPHITMYPGEFRAHVSLAYVNRNPAKRDEYIRILNERYAGKQIRVTGLNYGA